MAFTKSLSCWVTQSCVSHPDGDFVSFRVPHFKSQSLELDIILWLGTVQLIACPDPDKNLSCQLGRDISVVCLAADARGWRSGEALKSVTAEYLPFERCRGTKNNGTSILMMNSGESTRLVQRDSEIMFLTLW